MSTPNTAKWIGAGLLGLPLYGLLTFWSSLDPWPDPNTQYEAWARYVTTDFYLVKHLFASVFGLILALFGTFALGAYLAGSRAGRLGLAAMVVAVLGTALFLPVGGVSTFATPEEGQAYLAGIEEYAQMNEESPMLSDTAMMATMGLAVLLMFVGNVLLGVAVWRSGVLPRWAGALWAAGAISMNLVGMVYTMVVTNSTALPVPVGALLLAVSGGWMAWSVLRRPSPAETASIQARPRVQ